MPTVTIRLDATADELADLAAALPHARVEPDGTVVLEDDAGTAETATIMATRSVRAVLRNVRVVSVTTAPS